VINFFSAYYDNEYDIIADHNVSLKIKHFQVIARNYLTSWFCVDVVSAIPFDLVFLAFGTSGSVKRFAGFTRITKLYKIVRLVRLFRLLKIAKERKNIGKYMTEELRIAIGQERIIFMLIIYFVLQHIIACLW
jgi:hypothetical protein